MPFTGIAGRHEPVIYDPLKCLRSEAHGTGAEMGMPNGETATAMQERTSEALDFDVANRLFFRLYQCSNLVHKHGTRYMSDFGSTTQQWAVMGALTRPVVVNDGMTVKELIAFLMLSRQNLTAVLDRLEARGWIERVKDEADGRSRRIGPTKDGLKVWSRMLRRIDHFYRDALKDIAHADQVMLCHLLNKMRDTLSKM